MNKNDLRYLKTEENMRLAMLTLLKQKSPDKITVREICQLSKCSRNTFYLHYDIKEETYKAIVDEVLQNLSDVFNPVVSQVREITQEIQEQYVRNIISQVDQYRDSLSVLIETDQGSFYKLLYQTIRESILQSSSQISKKTDLALYQLQASYMAGALTAFIFDWLGNPSLNSDEVLTILERIHLTTMETSRQILRE